MTDLQERIHNLSRKFGTSIKGLANLKNGTVPHDQAMQMFRNIGPMFFEVKITLESQRARSGEQASRMADEIDREIVRMIQFIQTVSNA